jgi:DNA mismatch repair protein MutS
VERALVDEPPLLTAEGGMIRKGYHAELDELRDLARGGKEWIARYQAKEIERTGIPNLKIGFNKVFGYYLEVTQAQAAKAPADYIRKQTLKNQERYITPELKEHEDKVLRAEEQAIRLEQELFQALRERVAQACPRLQQTAQILAEVDVLTALAVLATKSNYCRPEITTEPILDVRDGRHPVLDRLRPSGEFVPNDVVLGVEHESGIRRQESEVGGQRSEVSADQSADRTDQQRTTDNGQRTNAGRVQLITGPNMAGKSTYIRQAALLTIMAQTGSFIPARSARIGIADRIFARVGASDELGKGQSTFMVEMTETARILNAATRRSLVILDEIGRGTSTYDGISLAWAVTEYLHDVVGCRTLFATHYHELTELTQTLTAAANWNVAVRETDEDVIFLHKIVPGAADKSYGIHVARLAGVPRDVIERARVILDTLEAEHLDDAGRPKIPERRTRKSSTKQLSLFGGDRHPLLDEIRGLNLDEMTPIAALQELHRLRKALASP